MNTQDQYLRTKHITAMFPLTAQTWNRYVREGLVPAPLMIGKIRVWPLSVVMSVIKEMTT